MGRPAGMVATGGWLVTTAGWLVKTPEGWPVTTPAELVCVRNTVAGLEYSYVYVLTTVTVPLTADTV